jgi:hypothetical protein
MVLAAGCGSSGVHFPAHVSLDRAKHFKQFTLYYAGHSVLGLPLTTDSGENIRQWIDDESSSVAFAYGTCEDYGTGDMATCNPPLVINNYAACLRGGKRSHSQAIAKRIKVRGVDAWASEGELLLTTNRTTIDIEAATLADALKVAAQLRAVNRPEPGPGQRLAPPDRWTITHKCRQQ